MGFLRAPNEAKIAPEGHQVPVAIIEQPSSSDDEVEEIGQPLQVPENRPRRSGQASRRKLTLQRLQDNIPCRACKVGRRWSRRVDNNAFLQNLLKQGEDVTEDVIQQEPSVFERLLDDKEAMKVWEAFINQSEEEQRAFLTRQIAIRREKEKEAKENYGCESDKNKPAGRKYFKRICPLIQEFLNCENVPKGTLLSLEPCLIEFFLADPEGQYFSDPLANDDRKVLHGLAQYLDLNSQSFNSDASYEFRCTRVTNPKASFSPPTVLLSEFLGIS